MRATAAITTGALALSAIGTLWAAEKLTMDDRIEIVRGMSSEYAKVKVLLPRSRKALVFDAAKGTYDKIAWQAIAKESGPAARTGDTIQITKVEIGADNIVLQINGGFKGGAHWYQGVQVGMGPSTNPAQVPIGDNNSDAPGGTSIVLEFHKPLEPIKAADRKKLLAPVLEFDRHTATELYAENIPPAIAQAVKEQRAVEGMTHEQVLMAMGRPREKSRETKDGLELEDWVYGVPPGKITFVTFTGDRVIKVKEEYAGLGTIAK